jgi:hypothetical protein
MKIIENITLYKCDFCKKELKRKWAIERHEERCMGNPIHNRPCFHCQHLERREIEFRTQYEYPDGEPVYHKSDGFFCAAKQQLLLHPKTQFFKGLGDLWFVQLDGKETEQFEMPEECNDQNIDL